MHHVHQLVFVLLVLFYPIWLVALAGAIMAGLIRRNRGSRP
jgi:hypothetical protein